MKLQLLLLGFLGTNCIGYLVPENLISQKYYGSIRSPARCNWHSLAKGNVFGTSAQRQLCEMNRMESENSTEVNMPAPLAESVLKDLDLSIDPCKNFYQFTCGGFIQNQSIPSGFTSKISLIQSKVLNTIRSALEEEVNMKDEVRPLSITKGFFRSCLNEGRIEMMGNGPLLNFLREMGGWPTLGHRHLHMFDFEGMLAKANPFYGVTGLSFLLGGAIIGVNLLQDFKQPGRFSIYLDQPTLGQRGFGSLPNYELYFLGKNSIYNRAYIQFGIEIAVELGADPSVAKKDMNDIFEFETKLASLFEGEEEQRRVVEKFNRLTVHELSLKYPLFDWLRFLQLLGQTGNAGVKFGPKDSVILWTKSYYDGLFPLLVKTPVRVLKNYIVWRVILNFIPAMSRRFQLISLRYDAAINGATEPSLPERSLFCTGTTIVNMQWVASRLLVERKLTASILSKAIEIKNYIRKAFRLEIETAKWIDEATRTNALKKFDLIKDNIGFPDYLLDNKFLELFYKNFNIKGDNFFDDLKEVYIQNYVNYLQQLTTPQFDRWILTPVITNAVHERGRNAIILTAAVLDEPLIREDYPPALTFGALGYLLAHEYQHAFDSRGIQFDAKGLISSDFWSLYSAKSFGLRTNCFVKQYSNYFLPDVGLSITNGAKTLDEDLCDNVGLKTAYLAYQSWKAKRKFDDRIPGLPVTGDELFFINVGRHWCSKWSVEFIFKFPLIDTHSLNRFRVIGPLQNLPEFSKTFKCPVGSPMNPKEKCTFW